MTGQVEDDRVRLHGQQVARRCLDGFHPDRIRFEAEPKLSGAVPASGEEDFDPIRPRGRAPPEVHGLRAVHHTGQRSVDEHASPG